jgi:DNA-binding protein YbaB
MAGGIMGQLGDLNKLRKQAKQMQDELSAEEVVVTRGDITVTMTAAQVVRDVSVQGIHSDELVKALNEAIKKSQEIAARKLQSMTGGLGGLLGGR